MPAFKRKRKSYHKKKPYDKVSKGKFYPVALSRKPIVNLGTTIPDTTVVRLKYCDDIKITVAAAGSNYLFRSNSIYDPDNSATGHQPLGHDQWASFYQRYIVTNSKITVTFKQFASGAGQTNVGVCLIANVGDTVTNPNDFMENNRTSFGYITEERPIQVISKKFDANKFFGLTNVVDELSCGAAFGSNPVDEAFFQLKMWSADTTSTSTRTVLLNVTLTYDCVLRERKNIGGS